MDDVWKGSKNLSWKVNIQIHPAGVGSAFSFFRHDFLLLLLITSVLINRKSWQKERAKGLRQVPQSTQVKHQNIKKMFPQSPRESERRRKKCQNETFFLWEVKSFRPIWILINLMYHLWWLLNDLDIFSQRVKLRWIAMDLNEDSRRIIARRYEGKVDIFCGDEWLFRASDFKALWIMWKIWCDGKI